MAESLIYQLQQLQAATAAMEDNARRKQFDWFRIVDALVAWRQECRLAKDYATADRIRDILQEQGIVITQGAIGLPPEKWGNLQRDDTWKQTT